MGVRSSQPKSPNLNKADGHLLEYFRQNFSGGGGGTNPPPPSSSIEATGGTISDYTEGSTNYRAHVFSASGSFQVTNLAVGTFPNNIDVVVIGGGGGGGSNISGGGGAGGYREFNQIPISSTGTYPLIIGAGGAASPTENSKGTVGAATTFFLTPYGPIVGTGGGGGGSRNTRDGSAGGSGGGACGHGAAGSAGPSSVSPDGISPTTQGNSGGASPGSNGSAGGGGAGGAGVASPGQHGTRGGVGVQTSIATGVSQYYAGGGGGSGHPNYGEGRGGRGGGGSMVEPLVHFLLEVCRSC